MLGIPLNDDIPCVRCRYNLRTRLSNGTCPECNTPVLESLRHYNQWTGFLERPRQAGNALILVAASIGIGSFVSTSFLPFGAVTSVPVYLIRTALSLLLILGDTIGITIFILSIRRLTAPPGAPWRIAALSARLLSTFLYLLFIALDTYIFYSFYIYHTRRPRELYAFIDLFYCLPALCSIAFDVIALPYTLRLCRMLASPWLYRATIALFIVGLMIMGCMILNHLLRGAFILQIFSPFSYPALAASFQYLFIAALAGDTASAIYLFILATKLRRL